MQHLTDYSQAWDREGERADALKERRDAIHTELTGDYETLKALIVETLAGKEKSELVEALAYAMTASWGRKTLAAWGADITDSVDVDDASEVNAMIKKEISARLIIEGDRNEQ